MSFAKKFIVFVLAIILISTFVFVEGVILEQPTFDCDEICGKYEFAYPVDFDGDYTVKVYDCKCECKLGYYWGVKLDKNGNPCTGNCGTGIRKPGDPPTDCCAPGFQCHKEYCGSGAINVLDGSCEKEQQLSRNCCYPEVTPKFNGTPIRLHIDNHPLKNLKVIIDDKTYTTDENGEVDIPENGEAKFQFIYFDQKEYFSIYLFKEIKPLELQIKTENGIITKGILNDGEDSVSIDINIKIEDFNFENIGVELYSTAERYVHLSEALEFYQDLGVEFKKPVKVITFVNFEGKANYQDYKILIDRSISTRVSSFVKIRQGVQEYFPFTEYHEFSHYAMNQMYGDEFYNELLKSPNHGGFANPTTADSWIEGFAIFMPVVIANHYDRWWTDSFLEKRPSFYPMAGSLDANYKPWEKEGKAEELAIAGFLWDFIDRESLEWDNVERADMLYGVAFTRIGDPWDENKDKKITAEELYVGQIMYEYAHDGDINTVPGYDMIEMGKDMEEYFDLEPDMELFEKYDEGDGFLDKDELDKMADILNSEGYYPVRSDWLEYYDDGDKKISREEAKHLLKGYEIIMEISKGKEVSYREDVVNWIKDERIRKYIDDNGIRPVKDEMSAREFGEYLLKQIVGNDDDSFEWSFEALWGDCLSKKHEDFTSVIKCFESDDEEFLEKFDKLMILHGMYQRKSPGDGVYNVGEAYTDSNKNKKWDSGEPYVDYPLSWNAQEGDFIGAPSNYERIGRESTTFFEGHYIKAPKGEYEIAYLIKNGMKIIDIVGYTAQSDGMLYVPIPSDSIVSVSTKNKSVFFTSKSFEENFEEIIKRGYITEIKDISTETNSGTITASEKSGDMCQMLPESVCQYLLHIIIAVLLVLIILLLLVFRRKK